jgi:hypothetical protein
MLSRVRRSEARDVVKQLGGAKSMNIWECRGSEHSDLSCYNSAPDTTVANRALDFRYTILEYIFLETRIIII